MFFGRYISKFLFASKLIICLHPIPSLLTGSLHSIKQWTKKRTTTTTTKKNEERYAHHSLLSRSVDISCGGSEFNICFIFSIRIKHTVCYTRVFFFFSFAFIARSVNNESEGFWGFKQSARFFVKTRATKLKKDTKHQQAWICSQITLTFEHSCVLFRCHFPHETNTFNRK